VYLQPSDKLVFPDDLEQEQKEKEALEQIKKEEEAAEASGAKDEVASGGEKA